MWTGLEEEATLLLTLVALAEIRGDETSDELLPVQEEVLQASLARTILPSVKEVPVYRVIGAKPSSGKPKAKNIARKEVTQLEQRQYRQQLFEAKMSEHKFWVDNDVYDLVDMREDLPITWSNADGTSQ